MGNLSLGTGSSSYYDYASRGQVFCATANVTAPVIYTTAAGTGGPLLWNNTGKDAGGVSRVNAVLLAMGVSLTTASGAAGGLGITGNTGQTTAPSSTTAIDKVQNLYLGGAAPKCNTYRIGTPTNAGNFFVPMISLGTGAVTVDNLDMTWVDLGGLIVVPPGGWASVAGAATATSAVVQVGLIWAEVPY